MKHKIINLRDAKPYEYKPLGLPRPVCVFRLAFEDRYSPENAAAKMFRNMLARGLYVTEKDLNKARNFVTIEIKQ